MNDQINNEPRSPILVTGGTGTLGRLVVAGLLDAGRDVRVLSRGKHDPDAKRTDRVEFVTADLATGQGVDSGVDGVGIVVHLAGGAKGDDVKARNLVRSAAPAGVGHIVYISAVGDELVPMAGAVDRAMFGYFGSKLGAEQAIAESGIPWTTLHATQFFDLTLTTARGLAKLPVIPVPRGFRFQPIDAGEVASRLVELALGEPAGRVPDLAGPRIYDMADLVRSYLRATNRHRLLIPMPVPGRAAAAIRAGANLAPGRAVGHRTWEEFLAEHVGSPRNRRVAAT